MLPTSQAIFDLFISPSGIVTTSIVSFRFLLLFLCFCSNFDDTQQKNNETSKKKKNECYVGLKLVDYARDAISITYFMWSDVLICAGPTIQLKFAIDLYKYSICLTVCFR